MAGSERKSRKGAGQAGGPWGPARPHFRGGSATCFSCVSELTCTSQISQWNVLFCRPVFPLFTGPLPFTPALGKALIAPLPFRASSIVLCLVPARNVKKKKRKKERKKKRRELLASNRLQDTMRQHHVMCCCLSAALLGVLLETHSWLRKLQPCALTAACNRT